MCEGEGDAAREPIEILVAHGDPPTGRLLRVERRQARRVGAVMLDDRGVRWDSASGRALVAPVDPDYLALAMPWSEARERRMAWFASLFADLWAEQTLVGQIGRAVQTARIKRDKLDRLRAIVRALGLEPEA